MRQNEHRYQGFLMLPGDLPKAFKIAMRDRDMPRAERIWNRMWGGAVPFRYSEKAILTYSKRAKQRGKKLQRQRDQSILREALR